MIIVGVAGGSSSAKTMTTYVTTRNDNDRGRVDGDVPAFSYNLDDTKGHIDSVQRSPVRMQDWDSNDSFKSNESRTSVYRDGVLLITAHSVGQVMHALTLTFDLRQITKA